MRKQQLVQKVLDLGTDLMWAQNEIAGLKRKLNAQARAMHDCPICGLRHKKGVDSDPADSDSESPDQQRDIGPE